MTPEPNTGGGPGGDLLPSLEPCFAKLLDRHKEAVSRTEWAYHEFLPEASRTSSPLSDTAYLAVETALLTEVNLPWYTATLSNGLAKSPAPIQEFVRLWTSEEDQHATLLESYLLVTRSGDPAARARRRKKIIATGWNSALEPFEGMVYTTIQEAATRTFYLCAARACADESAELAAVLRRIAKDETLHMSFYRDVVKAHLDLDAEYLGPLANVILRFEMPWSGAALRDFEERRSVLSAHGVFRLADYLEEVVQPLWTYWELDRRTPEGEVARRAQVQLRRYRAALRKFARAEEQALVAS